MTGPDRTAGLQDSPGFDLLSIRPHGEKRSIDVKGRAGTSDVEVQVLDKEGAGCATCGEVLAVGRLRLRNGQASGWSGPRIRSRASWHEPRVAY